MNDPDAMYPDAMYPWIPSLEIYYLFLSLERSLV